MGSSVPRNERINWTCLASSLSRNLGKKVLPQELEERLDGDVPGANVVGNNAECHDHVLETQLKDCWRSAGVGVGSSMELKANRLFDRGESGDQRHAVNRVVIMNGVG